MYLEAELHGSGLLAAAAAPQLDVSVANAVLTYLGDKYLIADPSQASSEAAQYSVAVPANQTGHDVSGQKTAAEQIQALTPGLVALVRDDEAKAIVTGQPIQGLHVVVTTPQWTSSYPGSSVLWPLTSTTEEKKKSTTAPIVGAVIGAGAGALVGGGVGAVVGGIGGWLVGSAVA